MARIHRQNGNPRLGYMFAKSALGIQFPEGDILFLQKELYDWMIYDEIAATAAQAGDMMLGTQCSMKLMQENLFPEEHRERIQNNFKHYQEWGHLKAKEEEAQKEAHDKAVEEVARNELEEKQKRIERQKKRMQEAKINKRRGKKAKVR